MAARKGHSLGMVALVLIVLSIFVSACGGGSSSSTSNDSSEGSTSGKETTNASATSASASPVVSETAKAVEALEEESTKWEGPTSAPPIESGKKIAYVSCGSFAAVCVEAGKALTAAAEKAGWEVTTIDGKGTVSGWLQAFDQAIALKPDGIISFAVTPSTIPKAIQSAESAGIPVVTMLGAGKAGPDPYPGVFFDASEQPVEIGKAMADYVIAKSEGKGRAVFVWDPSYEIAKAKREGFLKEFETCEECELLDDVNTPFANLANDAPGLTSHWIDAFGSEPFYIVSVGDVVFDSVVPTLKSRGEDPETVQLVGADGSSTSYERIRQGGQYQVADVPQPIEELTYESIDQLNRALHGEPADEYLPDPYLLTEGNIEIQGGSENKYKPANGYETEYLKIWGVGK